MAMNRTHMIRIMLPHNLAGQQTNLLVLSGLPGLCTFPEIHHYLSTSSLVSSSLVSSSLCPSNDLHEVAEGVSDRQP